jgi:hypothetical protein
METAGNTASANVTLMGSAPTVRQRVSALTLESNSEAASRDGDRIDTRAHKRCFSRSRP